MPICVILRSVATKNLLGKRFFASLRMTEKRYFATSPSFKNKKMPLSSFDNRGIKTITFFFKLESNANVRQSLLGIFVVG